MTLFSSQWKSYTPLPALISHTAHVWAASLNCADKQIKNFFDLLSADEKIRAKRFHFIKDQNHFIAARGILRKILTRYLNIPAQEIQFDYLPHGKPVLSHSSLQFNISHSKDIALFAFTHDIPVGIDVEHKSEKHDIDGIAQRFFSRQESAILKNLKGNEKVQAFYNGWTRKEAYLKAMGEGLSYPLAKVEVTLQDDVPPAFIFLHDKEPERSEWHLHALAPIEGYASALAVKGNLKKVLTLMFFNN